MLIDDDIDDQEVFAHALKHLNLDVDFVTANDGVHAIEKINSDSALQPYFIFLDINMPRMNGIDCLVEIKKISRVKNVPVYLYSTYGDPQTIKEGKKRGATDFFVKASTIEELQQTLTKILPKENFDL